jgi:hypothetical protein
MAIPLTEAEFGEQLRRFDRAMFRLELQHEYREPIEAETVARFRAGDRQIPTELAFMRDWYAHIRASTRQGKLVERVRVHDEPATVYQRWERWIGGWNIAAGERIRYLTREQAHAIGLLPAAGATDWWLIDDTRVILMHFDDVGHRIRTELTTDPVTLRQACAWRDLAISHGVLDEPQDTVTA